MAKKNDAAVRIGGITLLSVAAVGQMIDALKGKREAYQQSVHEAAVQALGLYAYNGDSTLVLRLVGGWSGKKDKGETKYRETARHESPLGSDRGWLVDWVARFSDLRFNDKGMIYRMSPKSRTYAEQSEALGGVNEYGFLVDLKAANANPFWTLEKAQRNATRNAIDLLNLFRITESLQKRIDSAKEAEAETGEEAYVKDQLDEMEAYAKHMHAAHEAFIAAQKIKVVDLEAARVLRKHSVATADVQRAVTTAVTPTAAGVVVPDAA